MGKDLKGKELGHGIMQKKNGRYEARYVDRFGKRVSISGRDIKDVKKRYNEAIYENDKQINVKDSITLDEWYKKWMNVYKFDIIRENTKIHYNNVYYKHISPSLGKLQLGSITQYQIKELIKELKNSGYQYETYNKVKILLVDIFNKAMINEYVRKNPAKGISLKRDEEKNVRVLSQDEQTVFFDCCKGTFYDNLFVTAVSTGMRIGELAALRWKDLDWDNMVIHVTRTLVYQKYEGDSQKQYHFEKPKTRTSLRDIPINRQCEIALKKQFVQKSVVAAKQPITKKIDDKYADSIMMVEMSGWFIFEDKEEMNVDSSKLFHVIEGKAAEKPLNVLNGFNHSSDNYNAYSTKRVYFNVGKPIFRDGDELNTLLKNLPKIKSGEYSFKSRYYIRVYQPVDNSYTKYRDPFLHTAVYIEDKGTGVKVKEVTQNYPELVEWNEYMDNLRV